MSSTPAVPSYWSRVLGALAAMTTFGATPEETTAQGFATNSMLALRDISTAMVLRGRKAYASEASWDKACVAEALAQLLSETSPDELLRDRILTSEPKGDLPWLHTQIQDERLKGILQRFLEQPSARYAVDIVQDCLCGVALNAPHTA